MVLLITITLVVSLVGGIYYEKLSNVVFGSTAVSLTLFNAIYFIKGGTLSAWLSIAIFIQLVTSFLVSFLVAISIFWFMKKQRNINGK